MDAFPAQPFADGVTVIVAVTGAAVAFVAVKEGMSPDPFAANPMAVLLFVQVKVVPLTGPVKVVEAAASLLQYV